MVKPVAKSLLDSLLAAPRPAHPHLEPINAHALAREGAAALDSVKGLMAYQRFLGDARAVKAKRKGASKAFERNVQRQSRQALSDLDGFLNSALRVVGQVNQTDFWDTSLRRASTALAEVGGKTARELWQDVRARPEALSVLSTYGLTNETLAICDNAISAADARVGLDRGHVEIFVKRPNGGGNDLKLALQAARPRPTTVAELLARPSFDQLAAVFSRGGDDYLAAVNLPPRCELGELVAWGAFASRQMLVDHVRKLEDTRLATYAGGLAGPLLVLVIVGLFLFVTGVAITTTCDEDNIANPPDWLCDLGVPLILIGLLLVGMGVFGGLLTVLPAGEAFSAFEALFGAFVADGLLISAAMVFAWGLGFEAEQTR